MVCVYVFDNRERADCPQYTILGRKIRVFLKLADPVPMLLQMVNGSSTTTDLSSTGSPGLLKKSK